MQQTQDLKNTYVQVVIKNRELTPRTKKRLEDDGIQLGRKKSLKALQQRLNKNYEEGEQRRDDQ